MTETHPKRPNHENREANQDRRHHDPGPLHEQHLFIASVGWRVVQYAAPEVPI